MTDPGDATLAAYETAAEQYLKSSARPAPELITYLGRLADMVDNGHVPEIGSGPGWDADYLESRGMRVTRTDATPAFVALLRAAVHDARRDKLAAPRYFTYWREPAVREVLTQTGWSAVSFDHVAGRKEPWLYVLARAERRGAAIGGTA